MPLAGKYSLGDAFSNGFRWVGTENDLISFAFNLISAINHIHSHGFIHRDLKPENIIIDMLSTNLESRLFDFNPETFTIIDFGSSYCACDHINDNDDEIQEEKLSFKKTKKYAPPEFINDLEVTEKYDIYSAGIILYMMVTNHYPNFNYGVNINHKTVYLPNRNINELFDPREWTNVSDELKELICSMLSFNPLFRPTAKCLLKSDIFACQVQSFSDDEENDYYL